MSKHHNHFKFIITDGDYDVLIQTPELYDSETRGAELEVIVYCGDYSNELTMSVAELYELLDRHMAQA